MTGTRTPVRQCESCRTAQPFGRGYLTTLNREYAESILGPTDAPERFGTVKLCKDCEHKVRRKHPSLGGGV